MHLMHEGIGTSQILIMVILKDDSLMTGAKIFAKMLLAGTYPVASICFCSSL
jgi:hypothetical protein